MIEGADMIFWSIVCVLYALVTLFAVYMTYQEQKRQARPSVIFNVIGYLACTIWPIVGAAAFIAACRRPAVFAPAERD